MKQAFFALAMSLSLVTFSASGLAAGGHDYHDHGHGHHGNHNHGHEANFFAEISEAVARFHLAQSPANSLAAIDIYMQGDDQAAVRTHDFRSPGYAKATCEERSETIYCNGTAAPEVSIAPLKAFIDSATEAPEQLERTHKRRKLPGFDGAEIRRLKAFRTAGQPDVVWVNLFWSQQPTSSCTKEAIQRGGADCFQGLMFCHVHGSHWDCHHNGNNRFHPQEPR